MLAESGAELIKPVAELSGIRPHLLYRHYKQVSGFYQWDQRDHAAEYLVFEKNIGSRLSIDEVSLTNGELYTYVPNKAARGRKGTLVASIEGTRSRDRMEVLKKIPLQQRLQLNEVTVDMTASMSAAVRAVFPNARLVIDRLHVGQLPHDVVQSVLL